MSYWFVFLTLLVIMGCSHAGGGSASLPRIAADGTASHSRSTTSSVPSGSLVPSLFSRAAGKKLKKGDFDQYIDSSVLGADRVLARQLMAWMPENLRGDFIYMDKNKRMISNNPKLLNHVELKDGDRGASTLAGLSVSSIGGRATTSERKSKAYFHDQCSPQDVFPNSGPYVRMVSKCGFTGGIGFVNLTCGTTGGGYTGGNGDAGTLYFEVSRGTVSSTEGGIAWLSDHYNPGDPSHTGMYPYYRSTYGSKYTNLNSRGFHYDCGTDLGIAHGLINNSNLSYTFVGQVPINFDPRLFWNGWRYTGWINPSWEFNQVGSEMSVPGFDAAGVPSPCVTCSISKVTSLAQNGGDRPNDDSYFGESFGGQAIHWMQVGFGEWLQGCGPGASFCFLKYSRDSTRYYGGEEFYYAGAGLSVQLSGPTNSGYGPWETWDGIGMLNSPFRNAPRRPASSFGAPEPPTCAADSYGYCVVSSNYYQGTSYCIDSSGAQADWLSTAPNATSWDIQTPTMVMETFMHQWVDVGNCLTAESWIPGEPSVVYGDVNLP